MWFDDFMYCVLIAMLYICNVILRRRIDRLRSDYESLAERMGLELHEIKKRMMTKDKT